MTRRSRILAPMWRSVSWARGRPVRASAVAGPLGIPPTPSARLPTARADRRARPRPERAIGTAKILAKYRLLRRSIAGYNQGWRDLPAHALLPRLDLERYDRPGPLSRAARRPMLASAPPLLV